MSALLDQKTFLKLFPVPEFLTISLSGIAITDYDTKFVELHRVSDGLGLTHSSQSINPEGAIVSGVIQDPTGLVPILKSISEHYGIHYARATLPEEKAYLFTTTIDQVPKEGLRDAIAFILEENVPLTLAEAVFDPTVISEDKVNNKLKVAVTVLPKEIVQSYTSLFGSAGITPISFDIESQAISRAVIRKGDKSPYLIVNFAHEKTGFYIVDNGMVQFSTTIASLSSDSDTELHSLRTEMQKVLTFWETHAEEFDQTAQGITKIILTGHGANNKALVEGLTGDTQIPHEAADVWLNLSQGVRSRVSQEIFEESVDYAAPIGSALSGRK